MRLSHVNEIEEQAALFALDALSPSEARSFGQRVAAGCPACRAALDECRGVTAMLPWAAPDATPPPDLRQRILDIAGAKRPRTPVGLLVRPEDTPWTPSEVPGVETRQLYGEKTVLIRMAPGTGVARAPASAS